MLLQSRESFRLEPILAFNPNHDEGGRFAESAGEGGGAGGGNSTDPESEEVGFSFDEPVVPDKIDDHIMKSYRDLLNRRENEDGLVTIHKLYDAMKSERPSLTTVAFKKELTKLRDSGKLQLQVRNEVRSLTKEQRSKGIDTDEGHLGYAIMPKKDRDRLNSALRAIRLIPSIGHTLARIEAYNPNHDDKGQFAESQGEGGGGGVSSLPSHESSPRAHEEGKLHTKVLSVKPLGGGINSSHIVELDGGSRGVWKPASGETLARRDIDQGTYYKRETAASQVAGVLDLHDLVPATTTREIAGEEGSVQEFVPRASVANTTTNPFDGERDHARAAAFDYLIGQTDRHDKNWMLTNPPGAGMVHSIQRFFSIPTAGDKIKLIDNGMSLPKTEQSIHFTNQDLLRGAVEKKVPDLSAWEGKWPLVEKSLKANGIEQVAIDLAKRRFDGIVKVSKDGGTFGDLPYANGTVRQMVATQPQGFRVKW